MQTTGTQRGYKSSAPGASPSSCGEPTQHHHKSAVLANKGQGGRGPGLGEQCVEKEGLKKEHSRKQQLMCGEGTRMKTQDEGRTGARAKAEDVPWVPETRQGQGRGRAPAAARRRPGEAHVTPAAREAKGSNRM